MFKTNNLTKIKASLVTLNSDLNPDDFMGLLELPKIYKKMSLSTLEKEAEEIEKYKFTDQMDQIALLDQMSEEADIIRNISSIGEELAIIGLYKTIELTIKKCAKLSNLFTESEISKMFNFGAMKKIFEDKQIVLEDIKGFDSFNEVRLINNSLKHSGVVSLELYNANPTIGDVEHEIKNLPEHFKRLIYPSFNFVRLLGIEIQSKMLAQNE